MSKLGSDGVRRDVPAHDARATRVDDQRTPDGIARRAGDAFQHLCGALERAQAFPSHEPYSSSPKRLSISAPSCFTASAA